MKFGDKLICLRKRKGMNQEELAEQLGVSRQSVSKWESNNSYPETDKIVQICNIFNCSMDDLINDNITNIDEIQRKDKNNLNIVIDSFLEFIIKTINMFSKMKFTSGLKCIIEMIILALILALVGNVVSGIFSTAIARVFAFTQKIDIILNVLYSIFIIIWIIIELIILVHTFKIRYLDYYDKLEKKEDKTINNETNSKEKIIIRDKNERPFAFLSVLSKIIIIFAKIFLLLFSINFIVVLFSLAIALVISIFLTPNSLLFLGTDISLISCIIINAIILILILSFVFDKKIKFKKTMLIFLFAIVFTGIGIGITTISFKNLKIDDKVEYNKTSKEIIDYKDNLVIVSNGLPDTEYEIDNSLNNIKITIYYNENISSYNIKNDEYYGVSTYEIHSEDKVLSPKDMYDMFIPDLKKNILKTNHYAFKIKITSNEEVINKLIDNSSKVYVFEKEETQNGYILKNISHKILEYDNCSEINDYNAITGEITTSGSCKCNINEDGDYLKFNCDYEE